MSFPGKIQVEVVDAAGQTKTVHIFDVKHMLPADSMI